MTDASSSRIADLLPSPAPTKPSQALLLFAMRRMAAAGIDDAHAAHAMLIAFGMRFRRPLVLTRALMAELSRVSTRKLLIAPHCCRRMTSAEAVLLDAVARAEADPARAHDALSRILGVRHCLGALSSAQAVGQAFGDLGLRL